MRTAELEGLLALDLEDGGLVRDGGDELVVDDDDRVPLDAALDDQVGHARGVREGGDVAADLVEGEADVVGDGAGELGLGLVADDHDGGRLVDGGVGEGRLGLVAEGAAGGFGDGGVDAAAEALVGGDDDEEAARLAVGGVAFLGVFKYLCGWEFENLGIFCFTTCDAPELAMPYCFPARMARWAFASFVDAIIFMDCTG